MRFRNMFTLSKINEHVCLILEIDVNRFRHLYHLPIQIIVIAATYFENHDPKFKNCHKDELLLAGRKF